MKRNNIIKKGIACLLAMSLALVPVENQPVSQAFASEQVSFPYTTKSIAVGGNYTLEVEGVNDSQAVYSWSSSNNSVAMVSSRGVVTGLSEGKATIKCNVTLGNQETKTLSCAITVKDHIPATAVKISNANRGMINAQTIKVGESFDFNRTLSPSSSNDKTYWFIQDEGYASVDSNGVVTALKEGITMLVAKSGIDRVEAEAPENTVMDYVYLNIISDGDVAIVTSAPTATPTAIPWEPTVPTLTPTNIPTATPTPTAIPWVPTATPTVTLMPTATPTVTPTSAPIFGNAVVTNVTLVAYDELAITFGQPIVESNVIKLDSTLTDYIRISTRNSAKDYGILTGKLSKDGFTLSIYASEGFDGTYYIAVDEGIQTTTGQTIASYGEQKKLSDTINPYFVETKIDTKGYINTICFSEPIDITNMEIVGVDTTCESSTLNILLDKDNYILSEDRKSLSIDLTEMSAKDENKDLMVVINGICDKAGNFTTPYSLKIMLHANTQFRAVANVVSMERVSLGELVVTFDGALLDAGEMSVGGYTVMGEVSLDNDYQAVYSLTEEQMKLTGKQVVTVTGWYSYYATDAATTPARMVVEFTPSVTSPQIVDKKVTQVSKDGDIVTTITLTYDKELRVIDTSGTLQVTLDDNGGYIIPMSMHYTAEGKGKEIVLTVADAQMSASGNYKMTIPADFAVDSYFNYTEETLIEVAINVEEYIKLPAPYEITQDNDDASVIYVKFANMLDKASAQNISNYVLANTSTPLKAELIEQTQSGATVKLTFPLKAIQYSGTYPIVVRNIKGYANSFGTMEKYTNMLYLFENTPPVVSSAKMVSANEVVLTFTESSLLQGTPDFVVTLPGSTRDIALVSYFGEGNTVHIELSSATSGYVIVKPSALCVLADENGNKASLEDSYTATRSY